MTSAAGQLCRCAVCAGRHRCGAGREEALREERTSERVIFPAASIASPGCNHKNRDTRKGIPFLMVEAAGFEPAAFLSFFSRKKPSFHTASKRLPSAFSFLRFFIFFKITAFLEFSINTDIKSYIRMAEYQI